MITPEIVAQIGRQIASVLPQTAKDTQQEIEKNVRAILQATISKLDLVSRDELDAQVAVLKRTREKLEQMELTLSRLEQEITQKKTTRKKAPAKKTVGNKI